MESNNSYSEFTAGDIFRNVLLISVLFFINKAGAVGNVVFFAILFFLVRSDAKWGLRAVMLTMLVLVGNGAFVERSGMIFAPGRFAILFFVAFVFYIMMERLRLMPLRTRVYRSLLLFVAVAALLAVEGGYFVHISLLKLLGFLVGFSVVLWGAEINRSKSLGLTCWTMSMILFTLLLGIFAYFAGVGYNAKTEHAFHAGLFNGPFYHPQTLGPACALMIVYLFAVFMYTPYRLRWIVIPCSAVAGVFLYMSSSRTAMMALVAGLGVSAFMGYIASGRHRGRIRMNIPKRKLLPLGVALGFLLVGLDLASGNIVSAKLGDFVLKGGEEMVGARSEVEIDSILYSRQGQIEMMTGNIRENPWTGIGFGTSSDPGFVYRAGLLSAPTEKGFLPLAILEETGIIGTAFFLLFLFCVYRKLFRERNIPGLGMFTAILGANVGEMMFFSFGGQGAFMWVLVAAGWALGDHCLIQERKVPDPVSLSSGPRQFVASVSEHEPRNVYMS